MATFNERQLQQGIDLIKRMPEVMPDHAGPQIQALYDDIQKSLRVPFVNFVFRVLANEPDFLRQAWNTVGPCARSFAFERAADTLRAATLLEPVPRAPVLEASQDELNRVRAFTDSIHYVLPKLLLIVHLLDPAPKTAAQHGTAKGDDGTIPYGVAVGTEKVAMVDPETAEGFLATLFEDIKSHHRHPGVATYFRSLGQWPAILAALWERLRPLVGSRAYEAQKAELETLASPLAGEIAACRQNGPPLPSRDDEAVLAVFRARVIPDLMLDVAIIKGMLDGTDAVRSSRFSSFRGMPGAPTT